MLVISPTLAPFGTVPIGDTSTAVAFTITNDGGVPSGSLTASLGGVNAAEFAITVQNCSGSALDPSTSCNVVVEMSPTTEGSKSATLTVTGTPGGTAVADLTGTGVAGAAFGGVSVVGGRWSAVSEGSQ